MNRNPLPLPWPVKGLSDAVAFADQPVGTCQDGVNVCNVDPKTGRVRGGPRSGTSEYVSGEVNGAVKVADLAAVERVNPRVVHAEFTAGNEETEWSREMPSKGACLVVKLDDQGNSISVDGGRALVKNNAAGVELWRISLPTSGEYDVVRALAVDIDTELGALVFAAVSDSTSQSSEPRMWCYRQLLDDKTERVWEEDPGGFVAHLAVRDGVLYAAVNDQETETAKLKAYTGLGTANPVFLWEKDIPYPANYNAVGKDGSTYICAPANATRNVNPRGVGGVTKYLTDWTPNDLERAKTRIWAWYDARNADGDDNSTIEDGEELTFLYDKSGNGRHLVDNAADPGPTFLAVGSTGFPSVHFDGTQALAGATGATINALQANVNKGMLPGHSGGGYAVIALCRVTPGSARQTFYQQGGISIGGLTHWTLLDTNQANAFTAGFGVASEHEGTGDIGDVSGAAADTSADGRYDREYPYGVSDLTQNYVILTRVFTNGWGSGASQKSLWRMNGQPLDSWFPQAGNDYTWTQATSFGKGVGPTLFGTFELMEMIVLREETTPAGQKRVVEYPDYPDATWAVGFQGTELEELEGYLGWRWGVSHLLPSGSYVAPTVPGDNDGNFPHAFTISGGPPRTSGVTTASVVAQLFDDGPVLAKFSPGGTGNVRWVITNPTTTNDGVGGIGYACEPNEEQTVVWSVGPKSTTGVSAPTAAQELQTNAVIRKVVDNGDTARIDLLTADPGPGAYAFGAGPYEDFPYEYPKIDVYREEDLGHLAVAVRPDLMGSAQLLLFLVTDTDAMTPHNGGVDLPVAAQGYAAAIVQDVPRTMIDQSIDIPEFIYAGTGRQKSAILTGTGNVTGGSVTVFDTNVPFTYVYTFTGTLSGGPTEVLIGATLADSLANLCSAMNLDPAGAGVVYDAAMQSSPNLICVGTTATTLTYAAIDPLNLANPVLLTESSAFLSWGPTALTELAFKNPVTLHKMQFVETTQQAGAPREVHVLAVCDGLIRRNVGGSWTTPSGGGNTLDPAARFVQSDDLNGKVYFTDGLTYLLYDSRAQLGAGEIKVWEAEGSGEMPKGAKLCVAWRGRMVLARTYDNPSAWFMSKVGDPTNWDYFPPEISADMAVAGTLSDIGTCPDVIQTLVPLSDDVLLFGGAGSFWVMRGDPAAGGAFDLLTDEMGAAFGRPWCKDPYGNAWVLGNRGALYRFGGDGSFQRVSEHRLDRRLAAINFSLYHVRLVWDEDGKCVHILLCPFGAAAEVRHFRYEVTLDAFWEEEFPLAQAVTSTLLVEGDTEAERVVLLGCVDGIVRKLDRNAKTDDGARIWSRVRFGPITPPGSPVEVGFQGLQIALADDESGCDVEVQVSDRADVPGPAVYVGTLGAGLSDTLPLRAKGAYVWLTLTNAKAGARYSYETGMTWYGAKGRKRVRSKATG